MDSTDLYIAAIALSIALMSTVLFIVPRHSSGLFFTGLTIFIVSLAYGALFKPPPPKFLSSLLSLPPTQTATAGTKITISADELAQFKKYEAAQAAEQKTVIMPPRELAQFKKFEASQKQN